MFLSRYRALLVVIFHISLFSAVQTRRVGRLKSGATCGVWDSLTHRLLAGEAGEALQKLFLIDIDYRYLFHHGPLTIEKNIKPFTIDIDYRKKYEAIDYRYLFHHKP